MCIFQQVVSTGLTLNMYISTLAMYWFQQTMGIKHCTFITTPSIIHDQDFIFDKCYCKNCCIFNKNVWIKNIWIISHKYKHISRNIGATMTASRKLAHDKV